VSILIDESTDIAIYGLADPAVQYYANGMIDYGSRVVGGIAPRGPQGTVLGRPLFRSVADCVRSTGARACLIMTPSDQTADAIMEAASAGVRLIAAVSPGASLNDRLQVRRFFDRMPAGERPLLVGPDAAGIIAVNRAILGVLPPNLFRPGPVGVVSRFATLAYEAASQLSQAGVGQSSCVCLSSDTICGATFEDVLALFESDPTTEAVLLLGQAGGETEFAAARFARERMSKPVVAFLSPADLIGAEEPLATAILAAVGAEDDSVVRSTGGLTVIPHPSALAETMALTLRQAAAGSVRRELKP